MTSKEDVPKGGAVAFEQGWDSDANPYLVGSEEFRKWRDDWHAANYKAYEKQRGRD